MNTADAVPIALEHLNMRPCDEGMIRAALLQRGWTYPQALTDARLALEDLVAQGRASRSRSVYQVITRAPKRTNRGNAARK